MEPNVKLDYALSFYYKAYNERKSYREHFSDIITNTLELQGMGLEDEAKLWIDKLLKDEYINMVDGDDGFYVINFSGMIFHLAGGYTQYIIDLESDRTKNRLHEKVIRIGAVVAGIYAAVEILTRLYTFFASFLHFHCY